MSFYNHWDYAEKAINSYYRSLDGKYDYHLIVLDDCSPDVEPQTIAKGMSKFDSYMYIRFKKNRGLTRSWNYGLDEAIHRLRADYVVIANDDIIIPNGAIGRLIDGLRMQGSDSIIGPLSNGPGDHAETQDIRNYLPDYAPSDKAQDIEQISQRVSPNAVVKVESVNGFFWAGRSKVFLRNTFRHFIPRRFYFDPVNVNYENEIEFQRRLRKLRPRVKLMVAANVFIFHYKDVSQESLERGRIPDEWVFRSKPL
ncbi:MAG: glycosyltransferase [Candidatus Omnitrophica bacterium]|nr:glycosyltransferase [Candidatus Omnitrophota bacterium]